MNVWIKTALALLGIWAVAYGIIFVLKATKPTAESVGTYLAHTDISKQQGKERARTITRLEDQLNDVSFDDRHKLQRSGSLHKFFVALTPGEQKPFSTPPSPPTSTRSWTPSTRWTPKSASNSWPTRSKTCKNGRRMGKAGPPPDVDPKLRDRFIDQGLRSLYKDASPDTKLDLAPLIEQMQRNLQMGAQG